MVVLVLSFSLLTNEVMRQIVFRRHEGKLAHQGIQCSLFPTTLDRSCLYLKSPSNWTQLFFSGVFHLRNVVTEDEDGRHHCGLSIILALSRRTIGHVIFVQPSAIFSDVIFSSSKINLKWSSCTARMQGTPDWCKNWHTSFKHHAEAPAWRPLALVKTLFTESELLFALENCFRIFIGLWHML